MSVIQRLVAALGAGRGDTYVYREVAAMNAHRIYYLTAAAIPGHLAHVVAFYLASPGSTEAGERWRIGIILAHSIMLALVAVLCLAVYLARRQRSERASLVGAISNAVYLSYLAFGAAVAAIDQLVTSNVTPYLMGCTGMAVLILARPHFSAASYVLVYALFYISVGWTQQDPDLLLSVRVNGITATCIGLCVTLVLWRNTIANLQQRKLIEQQKAELEEKNRQLELLATRDPLTGLLNTARFAQLVESEAARVRRSGRDSCLVMMDIDRFKQINDLHGHPVGDRVLKEVGAVLRDLLRVTDVAARLGGDEFAVLLPETSLRDGANAAERIRTAVQDHPFSSGDGRLQVTVSLGVVLLNADARDSLEGCYGKADEALYLAKGSGRNRVAIAGAVDSRSACR